MVVKIKMKALIFGGTSDIGYALTEILEEYTKYTTYFSNAERARKSLARDYFKCDITDPNQIESVFDNFSSLDLIVTCAFPFIESDSLSFEGYLRVEPYLRGHVLITSLGAKKMNKGGKIINLLGQSADHGLPGAAHYGASFAYLENLGKSINAEYGRAGNVSVHNLLLGPVDTKLWKDVPRSERERFEKKVVKFLDPWEIARLIRHIALSKVGPTKLVLDGFYSLPFD